ncbi:hypothetical protein ACIRU8_38210 [Streptomyces sp. NPDC101175]
MSTGPSADDDHIAVSFATLHGLAAELAAAHRAVLRGWGAGR